LEGRSSITAHADGPYVPKPLTAVYDGDELVNYQWKKDGANVATGTTYIPYDEGRYTVTVSLAFYNPKTSAPVDVTLKTLGDISITHHDGPYLDKLLSAVYSGTESVSYQWEKDGVEINGATDSTYTPDAVGKYTVTVSLQYYKSKTSEAVDVIADPTKIDFKGELSISSATALKTYTQLTADYDGPESGVTLAYQWKKGSDSVGDSQNFTPKEAGSYTVTISAEGYNSTTSNAVTVGNSDFTTVTIDPATGAETYKKMTAEYTTTPAVTPDNLSYEWKDEGGKTVSTDSEYTPDKAGSYTVTVSAKGFNPKASDPVDVALVINPADYNIYDLKMHWNNDRQSFTEGEYANELLGVAFEYKSWAAYFSATGPGSTKQGFLRIYFNAKNDLSSKVYFGFGATAGWGTGGLVKWGANAVSGITPGDAEGILAGDFYVDLDFDAIVANKWAMYAEGQGYDAWGVLQVYELAKTEVTFDSMEIWIKK
jgi:hypothetical protein